MTMEPQDDDKDDKIEGFDVSHGDMGNYPIDSLLIRSENRTVFEVVRRINQGMFIMDPDFQRDFVWKPVQQSRLIESVLMRIPLPVMYLAENPDGKLVVVDGLQRLTTFQRFIGNELQLSLENPELAHKTFAQLSSKLKNRIEDTPLILYVIDSKVPERARLDIFERVNSGVALTRQQMRNCLYQGPATQLLKRLAQEPAFLEATGWSLNPKMMRDREAINRFMGFQLMGAGRYSDDMDQFLATALVELNKKTEPEFAQIEQAFLRSMRSNIAAFGKHAFRKHEPGQNKRLTFNMSLFDVFSTELARYSEHAVKLKAQPIQQVFFRLMGDQDFVNSISIGTSGRKAVQMRFRMVKGMLGEVLGAI